MCLYKLDESGNDGGNISLCERLPFSCAIIKIKERKRQVELLYVVFGYIRKKRECWNFDAVWKLNSLQSMTGKFITAPDVRTSRGIWVQRWKNTY